MKWRLLSTIGWGMLWGLAWGFLLLAPQIVRTHYMMGTPVEAMKMTAIMAAIFATLGAGIGIGLFILAAITRKTRLDVSRAAFDAAIVTAVALPPVYVAVGVLIYFWKFRTIGGADWYQKAATLAMMLVIVIGAVIGVIHLATARQNPAARHRTLRWIAASTALIAASIVVIRFPSPNRVASQAHALQRIAQGERERRKLLVIGIDGGTWRTIEPLIREGKLPTLSSVIRDGIHGDVEALWPPYWSIAAWGAIATGHPREDVGVFGDVQVKIPGLPVFQSPLELEPSLVPITAIEYGLASRDMIHTKIPDRSSLHVPPVWEMLDRSGIETAVVRFNFSYPATGQAAFVVSNLAMADVWGMLGVRVPDKSGLVTPASRRDELLAPFSRKWKGDSLEFRRIFPAGKWPKPRDAVVGPVGILKGAVHFDAATMLTVRTLMRTNPGIDALFVHLGGTDNVEHSFWQYRFPNDFKRKPAAKDVAALGPVLDRYLEFVDSGIRQMIDAFPEPPNVLIVSDHGQGPREDGVPFKGWHASPGIFLAAGPDIVPRPGKLDVSYYDIVPTILDLKGLVKPGDLRGRSLVAR